MCISGLLGIAGLAGNLFSGISQRNAAKNAASAQELAALRDYALQKEGLDFQKSTFGKQWNQYLKEYGASRGDVAYQRTQAAPWLTAGKRALGQFQVEMGQRPGTSLFRTSPGYQFQVSEGEKGVTNNLAALGMKNSGAALKALSRFRMGLADQEYGDYMNRLAGMAGQPGIPSATSPVSGQPSTAGVSNALSGMGNALGDAGAARASGYVGGSNALTNMISGIGNTIGGFLGQRSYGGGWYPAGA